jgi:hypothetical protein
LKYLLRCFRKKHEVDPQLYLFIGAEFWELMVFGNAKLEWSCKNGSRAVPNPPSMCFSETLA